MTLRIKVAPFSVGEDVKRLKAAVRPASQAAAQVFYDRVKANVARIKRKTGNLDSSIYQAFSKDNSVDGRKATYHISWNAKKAPHGHLVEYGHIQKYVQYIGKSGQWVTDKKRPLKAPRHVGARPFMRPATAAAPQALEAAEAVLDKALE